MQIRIHKRVVEDMAVLVDWVQLEPLLLRSTFAPVDRKKIINAYSELWFDRGSSPWSFTLGEIYFHLNGMGEQEIRFTNGRNRTNLLIKHQSLIPICFEGGIPNNTEIRAAIIKPLIEGDIVDIIDLPIYPMSEIRKLESAGEYEVRTNNM